MPLIHIKSASLTNDQKKRIGDRIFETFHAEGMPASSVVILFGREDADILLEGGLLIEREAPRAEVHAIERVPAPAPVQPAVPSLPPPMGEAHPDYKSKLRRSKGELVTLKAQLVKTLQAQGALSSFQAQEELGLKSCEWAPATLRRFFSELEEEGVISKQGQKRGTRYVWKGITGQPGNTVPGPRLVKRTEDDPASTLG